MCRYLYRPGRQFSAFILGLLLSNCNKAATPAALASINPSDGINTLPGLNDQTRIGDGFDTFAQQPRGRCISLPSDSGGARTAAPNAGHLTFQTLRVTSQQDLADKMQVSVSASLSMGIVSLSGTASHLSERHLSAFSSYFLVIANVTNLSEEIDTTLRPEAAALAASDLPAFYEQCGDSVVYSRMTGGKFYGLVEIENSESDVLEEMHAKVSASGGFGLFSVEGKLDESLRQKLSNNRVHIEIEEIGKIGGSLPTTAADFEAYAKDFANRVNNSSGTGFPLLLHTRPYSQVFGMPHTLNNHANDLAMHLRIKGLAQRFSEYQTLLGSIDYIEGNPEIFTVTATELEALKHRSSDVSALVDKLLQVATLCMNLDQDGCSVSTADTLIAFPPVNDVLPIERISLNPALWKKLPVYQASYAIEKLNLFGTLDWRDPVFYWTTRPSESVPLRDVALTSNPEGQNYYTLFPQVWFSVYDQKYSDELGPVFRCRSEGEIPGDIRDPGPYTDYFLSRSADCRRTTGEANGSPLDLDSSGKPIPMGYVFAAPNTPIATAIMPTPRRLQRCEEQFTHDLRSTPIDSDCTGHYHDVDVIGYVL